jgi:hypothetical protein
MYRKLTRVFGLMRAHTVVSARRPGAAGSHASCLGRWGKRLQHTKDMQAARVFEEAKLGHEAATAEAKRQL